MPRPLFRKRLDIGLGYTFRVISKIKNPDGVTSAEIVVGIPSYNEADSIAFPVEVAGEGLLEHFADYSSVIVNVVRSTS